MTVKIKRSMGVCRIFLISCGIAAAGAAILWLIMGIVCAFRILTIPENIRGIGWSGSASDTATPWIMLGAGMVTYHRFSKICTANSVSTSKQTACLAGMSFVFSAAFACADLAFVKGVLGRLYGGLVFMFFEDGGGFFREYTLDKIDMPGITAAELTYPGWVTLLLLTVTAVYYYTFFLAGCYICGCIDSGRTKRSVFYLVTAFFGALFFSSVGGSGASIIIDLYMALSLTSLIAGIFTSPAVAAYWIARVSPFTGYYFILAIIFINVTIVSIHHVTGDVGVNDGKVKRTLPRRADILSRLKRICGLLRITALSAERPAAIGIILWTGINFGYAVYLGWLINDYRYYADLSKKYFIGSFHSDIAAPFILILMCALMLPRHTRLCAANSVSGSIQGLWALFSGAVFSVVFAAADIIFNKTVISDIWGELRFTFPEKYIYSLSRFDTGAAEPGSGIMSLFTVTALYYLAVFMTAYFYGRCIQGRSKFSIYILVVTVLTAALFGTLLLPAVQDTEAVFAVAMLLFSACIIASPHLMLVVILHEASYADTETAFTFLTVFCMIYIPVITVLSMASRFEFYQKQRSVQRA